MVIRLSDRLNSRRSLAAMFVSTPIAVSPVVETTVTASLISASLISVTFSGISELPFSGDSATFSFIENGVAMGGNLLTGAFAAKGSPATTAARRCGVGNSGGSLGAGATAGNFSQPVKTFQEEDASWNLSSLVPGFSTGAVTDGQADQDAGPLTPQSWAHSPMHLAVSRCRQWLF